MQLVTMHPSSHRSPCAYSPSHTLQHSYSPPPLRVPPSHTSHCHRHQVLAATSAPALTTFTAAMKTALAVAVAGAFAAAPPLWFCVVCPAVLGLLAPLAIK